MFIRIQSLLYYHLKLNLLRWLIIPPQVPNISFVMSLSGVVSNSIFTWYYRKYDNFHLIFVSPDLHERASIEMLKAFRPSVVEGPFANAL
jgi:hypothetical protein